MRFLTVTLNPAIDLVGRVDTLTLGEVNSIQTLSQHPAGKGINVALVLAKLGNDVTATGLMGEEHRSLFENFLTRHQVKADFVSLDGRVRTNVKITQGNDTTDLNFSGFEVSESAWQQLKKKSQTWAKDYDCVALCGSLPRGVSAQMFGEFCQSLTDQGVKWCLDTSGEALKAGIKAKPFLIKPNHEELQAIAPHTLHEDDFIPFAQTLNQQGIEKVLLSMGEKGACLVTSKEILHAKAPCKKVVSSTGAGDSLLGSFLSYTFNHDHIDALKQAVLIASLVVENAGIDWQGDALIERQNELHFSFI